MSQTTIHSKLPSWLLILWAAVITAGFVHFLNYATTSGNTGSPGTVWPRNSRLVRDPSKPTLLLFLHPHCPCSAASIDELAHIVARCPDRAAVHVLLCRPALCPPGWEQTQLWRKAEALPGATVQCDGDGTEARRFRVSTSGHALLFDAGGRLCFSGGITRARGHRGENAGRDEIVAWLRGNSATFEQTPIFGCPLHD